MLGDRCIKWVISTLFSVSFIFSYCQENPPTKALDINEVLDLGIDDLLKLNVQLSTGSYLSYDQKNSPLSMTIITADQIELSGARHLSELLEIYVPGFQYMINKWNGIIWGMRGVSSDRNTKFIFLVNGHKMNHESRDGAMSELDLGLLSDIQRIEVLRGPGGLVYGSGAIAGVINVVTKKSQVKEHIQLNSNLHTWQMNSGGAAIEGLYQNKLVSGLGITFSAGYRQSNGVGQESGRLWGASSFPYPSRMDIDTLLKYYPDTYIPESLPTSGSPWSTPGNFKASVDLDYKSWNLYVRATHQVTNGSPYFPVDGWSDIPGVLDSTAPSRFIDGAYRTWNSFYGLIEPWGANRRQYQIDNVMARLSRDWSIGENQLKASVAFDNVTNRIQKEELKNYSVNGASERNTVIEETFGERRFSGNIEYHLQSLEKLKIASGYQFRVFDIGNDMQGMNSQEEKANHPIVSDVTYFNHAFFTEGKYDLSGNVNLYFGARYDLHTRTIEHGGILSPMLGIQYKLNPHHHLSLIYQSSSNNGSADNYEFNRNSFDDNGNPLSGEDYHYEDPTLPPSASVDVLPPVTEDLLHDLKPERAHSVELSGYHEFKKRLLFTESISLNRIQDLFTWNQALFRMVNGGEYDFINTDFDLRYADSKCQIGLNHTFQRLVGMDLSSQTHIDEKPHYDPLNYDSTISEAGIVSYYPVATPDSIVYDTLNFISEGISYDGKHFSNLATNITKVYLDYHLTSKITFHTDTRIFWGLRGRKKLHEELSDFSFLNIESSAMIKWNASLRIAASERFIIQFNIYDILGSDNTAIHTLRWQKKGTVDQNALYGVDYRSFAINIEYNF